MYHGGKWSVSAPTPGPPGGRVGPRGAVTCAVEGTSVNKEELRELMSQKRCSLKLLQYPLSQIWRADYVVLSCFALSLMMGNTLAGCATGAKFFLPLLFNIKYIFNYISYIL